MTSAEPPRADPAELKVCLERAAFEAEHFDAPRGGGAEGFDIRQSGGVVAIIFLAPNEDRAEIWHRRLEDESGNSQRSGTVVYQWRADPESFDTASIGACADAVG